MTRRSATTATDVDNTGAPAGNLQPTTSRSVSATTEQRGFGGLSCMNYSSSLKSTHLEYVANLPRGTLTTGAMRFA
jgi:hypothetical protein